MKRSLGLVVLLLLAVPAQAASFDCRKARTADEHAICSDPLLSELDEVMALFYKRLRRYTQEFEGAMGLQARLKREARSFLRRRAACGGDAACIERAYRQRILQLLDWWRRAIDIGEEEDRVEAPPRRPRAVSCESLGLQSTPRFRRQCGTLEYPGMIERWELGRGLAACALPCTTGAYNVGYLAWLVDADTGRVLRPLRFPTATRRGALRQMDEVVSPTYDAATRTLRAFYRGRGLGDCGEKHRWRWSGDAFRLVAQQVKDSCDGNPRRGWRQVWPR